MRAWFTQTFLADASRTPLTPPHTTITIAVAHPNSRLSPLPPINTARPPQPLHTAQVFASKRKPFNMAKQRLTGTDAASYNRPGKGGAANTLKPAPGSSAKGTDGGAVPKWKAQVGTCSAWRVLSCHWSRVMCHKLCKFIGIGITGLAVHLNQAGSCTAHLGVMLSDARS